MWFFIQNISFIFERNFKLIDEHILHFLMILTLADYGSVTF